MNLVALIVVGAPCAVEIHTVADLDAVRLQPDGEYVLMSDLVVGAFEPIGDEASPFTGTFDGNGHTILGLVVDRPQQDNVGLFGLAAGAEIRDLAVADALVSGRESAGAVVGRLHGGLIENCTAGGQVTTATKWAGGIVGHAHMNCVIAGCESTADVWGPDAIGGIAGNLHASLMTGCTVSGAVVAGSGATRAGGLAGYTENLPEPSRLEDCQVSEIVVATFGDYAGGLVGYVESDTTIERCTATGVEIDCDRYGGGAAGYVDSGSEIRECGAEGVDLYGTYYLGGLVGYVQGPPGSLVEACSAAGTVTGQYSYLGGLVGLGKWSEFRRSSSTASVESVYASSAGALFGQVWGGAVRDCYSTGGVTDVLGSPPTYVGGLAGVIDQDCVVERCYAAGPLVGGGTGSGGIAGALGGAAAVGGCYWNLDTTGQEVGCGEGAGPCGAEGLTDAEMRRQSSFVGWDFETVWQQRPGEYPTLRAPGCPWDLDGDGLVNAADLLILLAAWTDPYGIEDLLELLAAWGCGK